MSENQDYREILRGHQATIADRWYKAIVPLVPGLNAAEARARLAEWTRQAINLLAEPL